VLQGWVLESFSGITKSPRKKVKFPIGFRHSKKKKRRLSRSDDEALVLPRNPPFIWTSGEKYNVKSSDGRNILEVSWALPSLRKVYEHKPEEYVSYLLNQGKRTSLDSLVIFSSYFSSFNNVLINF
jgi:secreted Zn-dependent insulinase-like peptidase